MMTSSVPCQYTQTTELDEMKLSVRLAASEDNDQTLEIDLLQCQVQSGRQEDICYFVSSVSPPTSRHINKSVFVSSESILSLSAEDNDLLFRLANAYQLRLQSLGITSSSLLKGGKRQKARTSSADIHSNAFTLDALLCYQATSESSSPIATSLFPLTAPSMPVDPRLQSQMQSVFDEIKSSNKPYVVIMRGIPGSGKSYQTSQLRLIASQLDIDCQVFSADYFFETKRGYVFNPKQLQKAHATCKAGVEEAIKSKRPTLVIVDNTNTQLWEYDTYVKMAEQFHVPHTIVQVQCDNMVEAYYAARRNSHGVPVPKVLEMYLRWQKDSRALSFRPHFVSLPLHPLSQLSYGGVKTKFIGIFFPLDERQKLKDALKTVRFENVYIDHVTMEYGPSEDSLDGVDVGKEVDVDIEEEVWDDRGQALRIRTLDSSFRCANRVPHITVSTAANIPASYSNELLEKRDSQSRDWTEESVIVKGTIGISFIVGKKVRLLLQPPFETKEKERNRVVVLFLNVDEECGDWRKEVENRMGGEDKYFALCVKGGLAQMEQKMPWLMEEMGTKMDVVRELEDSESIQSAMALENVVEAEVLTNVSTFDASIRASFPQVRIGWTRLSSP